MVTNNSDTKKRILIVHNKYNNLGGEDIAVSNEIRVLKKKYTVEILFFDNKVLKGLIFNIISIFTNKNYKSTSLLKNAINTFSPDLIYIHNSWFKASNSIFSECDAYNIPIVVKLHNFRYFCTRSYWVKDHIPLTKSHCKACYMYRGQYQLFNKYFSNSLFKSIMVTRFGKKYFNILSKSNFYIFVLTNFHKQFLIKLGINRDRIIVNYNPVEINPETLSLKDQKPYFLYAGRISHEKGLTELIDSFIRANLKNFDLVIAGDGPSLSKLKKKYNIQNIVFLGQKNNDEIINLIKNCRAVITATKIFEGQPTILTEASLNNTLSIFPITGGVPEFFPVDYKFKYDQNNYESLTKMMIDAANSKNTEEIKKECHTHILSILEEDRYFNNLEKALNNQ